ncbi:hypothetical protein J2X83_005138 [Brevibacillus nitrificans]|nr:hypothetical protein [Brevibacillus nitrificans]
MLDAVLQQLFKHKSESIWIYAYPLGLLLGQMIQNRLHRETKRFE